MNKVFKSYAWLVVLLSSFSFGASADEWTDLLNDANNELKHLNFGPMGVVADGAEAKSPSHSHPEAVAKLKKIQNSPEAPQDIKDKAKAKLNELGVK